MLKRIMLWNRDSRISLLSRSAVVVLAATGWWSWWPSLSIQVKRRRRNA
ncbi:unnamed protein product [Brassica oleracea]